MPNGISIGSAVFAALTNVTDTQTDTQTDHATKDVATGSNNLSTLTLTYGVKF